MSSTSTSVENKAVLKQLSDANKAAKKLAKDLQQENSKA